MSGLTRNFNLCSMFCPLGNFHLLHENVCNLKVLMSTYFKVLKEELLSLTVIIVLVLNKTCQLVVWLTVSGENIILAEARRLPDEAAKHIDVTHF